MSHRPRDAGSQLAAMHRWILEDCGTDYLSQDLGDEDAWKCSTHRRESDSMNVTVIDAVMGSGKTHWMKAELARRTSMFAERHERFIYITPYLLEAGDAVKDITAQGAQDVSMVKDKDLEKRKTMLKRNHLYELLMAGKSAVGSHRLFEVLDPRTMRLIELGHYVLVIDEATQWVQKYEGMKASDLGLLFHRGLAYVGEDLVIRWNDTVPDVEGRWNEKDANYSAFRSLCLQGKLVASDPTPNKWGVPGSMLLWTMPVEMLKQFSEVFVLTHLFEGSEMSAYLRMNKVEYEMKTLDAQRNIVEYTHEHNAQRVRAMAGLITIVEDPRLNAIGDPVLTGRQGRPKDPLSKGWFESDLKEARRIAREDAPLGYLLPPLESAEGTSREVLMRMADAVRYSPEVEKAVAGL
jgi:hypothetical protein